MDKDATIVFLDRFAVRVAGVVDPTRFVPADLGGDDVGAIVDSKKKGVRIVHIGRNTFPRDATTRVFNDAPALSDGSGRENAPTVNSRLTHLNERHGEEARCASLNGYLLSIIESKELAKAIAAVALKRPVNGTVGQARLPSRSLGEDWSPADPRTGKRERLPY